MPIQVKAPDGSIVQFPDGTADDVIVGVMKKNFGGPAPEAPQGDPNHWSMMDQGLDTLTMGGSTKLGAAGGSLVDSVFDAAKGNGFNYSQNYDKNLNRLRSAQSAYNDQNPGKTALGNAAGVALGVTSLPTIGSGFTGAVGTGAAYGAGGGALQDANTLGERATNTAKGAGFGGLLGGAVYGVAKGVSSLLGGKTAPPPTADQWHGKAQELYSAADNGFGQGNVSVDDVMKLADDFDKVGGKAGENNPFGAIANKPYQQTLDTVQKFRQIAGDIAAGNTSQPNYSQLEQLRQSIRAQSSDMVRPDGKMTQDGMRMSNLLDAVDGMLLNSPYKEARAAYATAIKADRIGKAFSDAELTAGSNYTQAGMEKAVQGEFKKIAKSKNFESMFTPEEQEAIKKVVNPGGVHKVMKMFGGFAPKGGLSMMFNIGLTANNPLLGGAVGAGSSAAKYASTAKTLGNAKLADELIRSQGAGPQNVDPLLVQKIQQVLLPTAGLLGDSYLRTKNGVPR